MVSALGFQSHSQSFSKTQTISKHFYISTWPLVGMERRLSPLLLWLNTKQSQQALVKDYDGSSVCREPHVFFTLMFCAAWKSTNCCRPHYTASFGPWCMLWCQLALCSNCTDMEILSWQLLHPLELVNSNMHPFLCVKKHLNAKTFWVSWNKWQMTESNNQGCSLVDKEVFPVQRLHVLWP